MALNDPNQYSNPASALLSYIAVIPGAEKLIRKVRGVQRLAPAQFHSSVATEDIRSKQPICEISGFISLSKEAIRKPGGGNGMYQYDGLMGPNSPDDQKLCIDTNIGSCGVRSLRRSCQPNSILHHALGPNSSFLLAVVAVQDIPLGYEVTIPFDTDWMDSEEPLQCAAHFWNMRECEMEQNRLKYQTGIAEKAMLASVAPEPEFTAQSADSPAGPSQLPQTEISEIQLTLDDANFLRYFAEKSKTLKNPLYSWHICEEYINAVTPGSSPFKLCERFLDLLLVLPFIIDFDKNTKSKMMFISGAKLDAQFLTELREHAHVIVDSKSRIIKYESYDGCFRFEGNQCDEKKDLEYEKFNAQKQIRNRTDSSYVPVKASADNQPDAATEVPALDVVADEIVPDDPENRQGSPLPLGEEEQLYQPDSDVLEFDDIDFLEVSDTDDQFVEEISYGNFRTVEDEAVNIKQC